MVPNARLTVTLLGEPRAWYGDSPVVLGRGLQAAAFVALALRPNGIVSREELIAALWDGTPPRGASSRIYTYVSALRRAVETAGDAPSEVLRSCRSGYRLAIAPADLDAALLQRHRDDARAMRARGDARGELSCVNAALALWEGEALHGVPGPLALSWRGRMEEVKSTLMVRRAFLMIDEGHHDEVVDELRDLSSRHPAREDVYHSLMTALSRSGRQAEALKVYRQARGMLVERFGTEPGTALRALRQEVLTDAEPVVRPGGATGGVAVAEHGSTGRARARLVSARASAFVGRTDQVVRVRAAVAAVRAGRGGALRVAGPPGSGKTSLIGEGLADLLDTDALIGWGVADELSCRVPLGVLENVFGGLDAALLRRAGLAGQDLAAESAGRRPGTRIQLGGVLAAVPALLDAAGGRPLVLVIDDLHWADDETLLVWRHLHGTTRHHPVLLISASRPMPRRRNLDLLHVLVAESGCDTIELAELTRAEVREVLRTEHAFDERTADVVARMSGGNPAFVHAIGRSAATRPVETWSRTPDAVARVVHRYLDGLSADTGDVLRRAALLGDSHTVGDLVRASGRRAHDLLTYVDESLAGGVLVDLGGSRLRFRHPIVRRVLHESVPVAMRRAALDDAGVGASTVLSTYWCRPADTSPPEGPSAPLVPAPAARPRHDR
jgi:DNA-binding SARP family transcriptional activator